MPTGRGRFAKAAKEAAAKTNERLGQDLAQRTRLTEAELANLFPEQVDKERLAELLDIVNSATSENEQILRLKKNIDALGAVAIRLVKALAG